MCKWGNDTLVTLPSGKVIAVDSCIADFVDRLNKAGINTIASCCGHGKLPTTIAFGDDQWMMIVDRKTHDRIERIFDVDIHGEAKVNEPVKRFEPGVSITESEGTKAVATETSEGWLVSYDDYKSLLLRLSECENERTMMAADKELTIKDLSYRLDEAEKSAEEWSYQCGLARGERSKLESRLVEATKLLMAWTIWMDRSDAVAAPYPQTGLWLTAVETPSTITLEAAPRSPDEPVYGDPYTGDSKVDWSKPPGSE